MEFSYEPEEIQSQFEKITKEVTKTPLHCRFIVFDSQGPTWKKRLELRSLLIKDLGNSLENFSEDYKRKLLIPGKPPKLPEVSISISHCPVLGGFIFSHNKNISLGLDIEKMDRVNLQSIQRVSGFDEINESPEISFLWVAKEAAFKCVPSEGQKDFLKNFFIFNWQEAKTGVYHFNFSSKKSPVEGKGVILARNHLAFGCAFTLFSGNLGV